MILRRLCLALIAFSVSLATPAQAPFTEEAAARGISYSTPWTATVGTGVALTDLDGDGDPDIVVQGKTSFQVGVYENDGTGQFINRSVGNGIPAVSGASGITAADYDGDGDLDLYFSRYLQPNLLMRNDGGFLFTNVTATAMVGDAGAGTGTTWADYDGDGWLDLYLSNRTAGASLERNRLFHNLGSGVFEDVAATLGVDGGDYPTLHASFFDHDLDGWPDLYLCTDKGSFCDPYKNFLFKNLGGTFLDVTDASGTEACVDCMGTAIGDLDRNGYQDLYCTNLPPGNVLMMNQGNGQFVEMAVTAGVGSYATGWGTIFLDYDNDGFLELFVTNSDSVPRLYDCDGAWPCIDRAMALGLTVSPSSACVSAGDIDGDGDLDLLVQGPGSPPQPMRLFVNHEGETRNWLKVRLHGHDQNTHAIGARVEIVTGSVRQNREMLSGAGYKSDWPTVLHFGLGASTQIDRLDVRWPDGARSVRVGVAANQELELGRPPAGSGPSEAGPLHLARNVADPSKIDLAWSAGCGAAADYAVYEGQIGQWSGHVPATCTTGGVPGATLAPQPGPRYFLAVPLSATDEGSYGVDSAGRLRSPSATACRAQIFVEACAAE